MVVKSELQYFWHCTDMHGQLLSLLSACGLVVSHPSVLADGFDFVLACHVCPCFLHKGREWALHEAAKVGWSGVRVGVKVKAGTQLPSRNLNSRRSGPRLLGALEKGEGRGGRGCWFKTKRPLLLENAISSMEFCHN